MKSPLYYTHKIKLKEHLKYFHPTYISIGGKLIEPEDLDEKYLDYYLYKSELININGNIGGILYLLNEKTQKEL